MFYVTWLSRPCKARAGRGGRQQFYTPATIYLSTSDARGYIGFYPDHVNQSDQAIWHGGKIKQFNLYGTMSNRYYKFWCIFRNAWKQYSPSLDILDQWQLLLLLLCHLVVSVSVCIFLLPFSWPTARQTFILEHRFLKFVTFKFIYSELWSETRHMTTVRSYSPL